MKWRAWMVVAMMALARATLASEPADSSTERWSNTSYFEHGLFSSAHYDARQRTLMLVFRHGAAYVYYDVHPDDYVDFIHADNQGIYFNEHFRYFHHFERVVRYIASACRNKE